METQGQTHYLKGGLEQDAPMHVNEQGGKQSKVQYAFHHADALTMLAMAKVLYEGGQKYGAFNWRRIPAEEHLNHALMHIYAHLAQDGQDDHLAHALVRVMMALSLHLTPEQVERMKPE